MGFVPTSFRGMSNTWGDRIWSKRRCESMRMKSIASLLLLTVSMFLLGACKDENQSSKLLTAVDEGKSDIVQELLDSGIDPNRESSPDGAYPLHLASLKGNKLIVQMLLDNGAEIDLRATNKDKATPLAWAAFFGQKDVVSLLIEAGASINALDANHGTPLDAATFAWRASQDNAAWAKNLMEIITIIKAKGGKPADEL